MIPNQIFKRGIIAIFMVITIGGLSLLTMLFHEEILRFYRASTQLRMLYVKQLSLLQKRSLNIDDSICNDIQVPINQNNNNISFTADIFADGIQHFVECRRVPLFKIPLPTKKHYQVINLDQFIYNENLRLFADTLNTAGEYQLLYFHDDENYFELKKTTNGIILAEGNLHLSGKGRFRGAIVTVGGLSYEDGVKISYSKAIVEATAQQFSRWVLSRQGWSDFIHHGRQQ